jgi:hypothetical protein
VDAHFRNAIANWFTVAKIAVLGRADALGVKLSATPVQS